MSLSAGWDGENITQEVPRVLQGELPYTLSRSAMLQSPHGIDHVLSNCPLTPLSYTAGNLTTAQVRAHLDTWVPAIPAGRRVLGVGQGEGSGLRGGFQGTGLWVGGRSRG